METARKTLMLPDGRSLEYTVDRGQRKNIYITIKGGRVILKLPMWAAEAQGERFLLEKAEWVLKNIKPRISEAVIPDRFVEGTVFTLHGEEYTVCCEYAERYFPPRFEEGRLVVSWFGRDKTGDADKEQYTDSQVRLALKQKTLELVNEGFQRLTALTGLCPKKVTVKRMTASWGRCSSAGNISINANIVFYPPECLDYVIIHELCHLRHMDHSAAFWELVGRYCPDWKSIRHRMKGQ